VKEDTIKREINELKMKIKNIKKKVNKGKTLKKESNRNTKHRGRPVQQIRTSGRQNLRTRRQNRN
jgi:hypothetical protein